MCFSSSFKANIFENNIYLKSFWELRLLSHLVGWNWAIPCRKCFPSQLLNWAEPFRQESTNFASPSTWRELHFRVWDNFSSRPLEGAQSPSLEGEQPPPQVHPLLHLHLASTQVHDHWGWQLGRWEMMIKFSTNCGLSLIAGMKVGISRKTFSNIFKLSGQFMFSGKI